MTFIKNVARVASVSAALLAAVAVSSCGGGDAFTGLWEGSVDGNRPATAIVLGDGTYYMKYAPTPGNPRQFGGLVRGTGDFRGATFTSTDGIDYHFAYPPERPTAAAIQAKITVKGRQLGVAGTVNTTPLSLTWVKAFDADGRLKDLAGSYPGEVTFTLGVRQTTFEVTADGKLTTSLNGCAITGQVVPRPDDAFDLTIQFGASPCAFPGAVFQGAAIYSHELQQLDAAVVYPAAGQAITFIAKKTRG